MLEKAHILVIGDEQVILELIESILTQETNHQVSLRKSPPKSITEIETIKPDLIILDLKLGIDYGEIFLEKLQAQPTTKDIPVLICTGSKKAELPFQQQSIPILYKPFNIGKLLEHIKQLLPRKLG